MLFVLIGMKTYHGSKQQIQKPLRSRLAEEYIYYSKETRTTNNRGLYVWDAESSNKKGTKGLRICGNFRE
jgi:hypothetical protein